MSTTNTAARIETRTYRVGGVPYPTSHGAETLVEYVGETLADFPVVVWPDAKAQRFDSHAEAERAAGYGTREAWITHLDNQSSARTMGGVMAGTRRCGCADCAGLETI